VNKTIIYILLLLVLGFGVYYFIFRDQEMFGSNEAGFQIRDTNDIQKIFLADKQGNSITLTRSDKGWMLNDQYPVMPTPVHTLLATLATQKPAYPVPDIMHNTVVKTMAGNAIKVELYNKDMKKTKVFFVGGQANNNTGTYMLMDGAKRPYVVQIPGFEGYVTPRYSTDLADWRDRTVTDIAEADIRKVEVTYPEEPLNSFVLMQNEQGSIEMKADSSLTKGKPLNVRRAKVFTGFFKELYSEGYIMGDPGIDTVIAQTKKLAVIDIEGANNKKQHIELFWMPINQRSKNMLAPHPGTPVDYDADRFYATINNFKDTIIVQSITFDKILRKAWEFYEADEEVPTPTEKKK
jgi:hypothetical protein